MKIVSGIRAAMFLLVLAATPASAVFESDTSKRARSSDSDHAMAWRPGTGETGQPL